MIEKATKQEIACMLRALNDKAWEESNGYIDNEVWEKLYDKAFPKRAQDRFLTISKLLLHGY